MPAEIQLNKEGPYYGITVMRNGELVRAKGKSSRERVRHYVENNPGCTETEISKALRLTNSTTESALRRLKDQGCAYCERENAIRHWYIGEHRETPQGLINSIWNFADRLGTAV